MVVSIKFLIEKDHSEFHEEGNYECSQMVVSIKFLIENDHSEFHDGGNSNAQNPSVPQET